MSYRRLWLSDRWVSLEKASMPARELRWLCARNSFVTFLARGASSRALTCWKLKEILSEVTRFCLDCAQTLARASLSYRK